MISHPQDIIQLRNCQYLKVNILFYNRRICACGSSKYTLPSFLPYCITFRTLSSGSRSATPICRGCCTARRPRSTLCSLHIHKLPAKSQITHPLTPVGKCRPFGLLRLRSGIVLRLIIAVRLSAVIPVISREPMIPPMIAPIIPVMYVLFSIITPTRHSLKKFYFEIHRVPKLFSRT